MTDIMYVHNTCYYMYMHIHAYIDLSVESHSMLSFDPISSMFDICLVVVSDSWHSRLLHLLLSMQTKPFVGYPARHPLM